MENNIVKTFEVSIDRDFTIEKAGILLAMTSTRESEEEFKKILNKLGYTCAVTEIAGTNDEVKKKIVNAVLGASFNLKIIEKTQREIHGLIHAALEACLILSLDMPMIENFLLKVAIVRKKDWVCVAIYGQRAIHSLTNQRAVGLGVMHV